MVLRKYDDDDDDDHYYYIIIIIIIVVSVSQTSHRWGKYSQGAFTL